MKRQPSPTYIIRNILITAAVLFNPGSPADDIDWDGSTGSVNTDTGGDTSVQDNWGPTGGGAGSPGVLPTLFDRARLQDVTTGTRTVTVDTTTTWGGLDMTQTSAAGGNSLLLDADLTLGRTTTGGVAISMDSTAGNSSLTLDLNGFTLETNGNGSNYRLDLDGTVLMGSGSVLQLNDYRRDGTQILNNAGVLSMDTADIVYDWRSDTNGLGVRNFNNTGEWTMENGSTLTFISTEGRPLGGFGNMEGNTNSGILSVLSNSSMTFQDLTNTGTLELGGGTALVHQSPGSGLVLNNSANGIITISGDTTTGAETESSNPEVNNGVASSTVGVINVGDGTNTPTWTIRGGTVDFNNNSGNTLNVNQGATLHLHGVELDDGSHPHNPRLTTLRNNGGTLNLSGKLIFQPNQGESNSPKTSTVIQNSGTFNVTGGSATIEKEFNLRDDYRLGFNNNAGGSLRGDGLMTYVNSTGESIADTLLITNSGDIEAGNGSNGSLLSSVGNLELTNTEIVFASGGSMIFDIGGETSGTYDVLTLSGTGAGLDLSASGDSVTFNLVNGYTPSLGNMTWTVLNASVAGTFDTVNLPDSPGGDWSFDESSGVLSVSVIPEPTSLLLLIVAGGLFCLSRRHRPRVES